MGTALSTALQTAGLGKRYGRTWALRDCSLELPPGRVAALVGPNGAGKTTLLHLAIGLLRPDEGGVEVMGHKPFDNPHLLGQVGFVAQDTPLYPDFSAAELIRMGAKLNRRWDTPLATERLTRLGIAQDRPVRKLSGGQRAQVALALALAKRPRLLLLDEPVASLDPLARREFMQALMGGVTEEGMTVMFSSHLLDDLERVCDYLIVLKEGNVRVKGDVEELVAAHNLLIGRAGEPVAIPGVAEVVRETHSGKQASLLVRTEGPVEHPEWTVRDVTLEDLVLAYLSVPARQEVAA
ncbi:MAG TPA: ABC transporter ATP-binding protein [Candidatus Limnocylindrales bacterium]|nr:ABC transporter ATP-binding protein [Candidatus Limnocylindrales bacterium]